MAVLSTVFLKGLLKNVKPWSYFWDYAVLLLFAPYYTIFVLGHASLAIMSLITFCDWIV